MMINIKAIRLKSNERLLIDDIYKYNLHLTCPFLISISDAVISFFLSLSSCYITFYTLKYTSYIDVHLISLSK